MDFEGCLFDIYYNAIALLAEKAAATLFVSLCTCAPWHAWVNFNMFLAELESQCGIVTPPFFPPRHRQSV